MNTPIPISKGKGVSSAHMGWKTAFRFSFYSAFCGWIALNLVLVPMSHHGASGTCYLVPVVSGFFVFVPWLMILAPVFRYLPLNSVIWWWPLSTVFGALSGVVILCGFWLLFGGFPPGPTLLEIMTAVIQKVILQPANLLPALCGAVIGLFAGLMKERFVPSLEETKEGKLPA